MAARRLTAERLLPSNPTVEVQIAHRSPETGPSDIDRGLELSQSFEVGGQRGLRIEAIDEQELSARMALVAAQRSVANQVMSAAALVWVARGELTFATDERELAARLSEVAKGREQHGVGVGLDVDLAQAAQLRARRDELAASSALQAAEAQLATAVGADVALAADAQFPKLVEPSLDLAALERSAVENQPDILAAKAEANAARAQRRVLERERVPEVTLGAGVRHEEFSQIVGGRLSVPVPLFVRSQGEIAEQEVRATEADSAATQAELRARLDVRTAYEAWQQTRAALNELPPDLEARLAADVIALRSAYEQGALPMTAVLASLRETSAARRALLDLRNDALTSWLTLSRLAALSFDIPHAPRGTP